MPAACGGQIFIRSTLTGSLIPIRILRTLHTPASRRAENSQKVVVRAQNFEGAPRASHAPKTTKSSSFEPRISTTLHVSASRQAEQNERASFASRNSRTHHAPVTPRATSKQRVVIRAKNFEHAPHASVTTGRGHLEGRHSRREFRGRSTRQRDFEQVRSVPQPTRGLKKINSILTLVKEAIRTTFHETSRPSIHQIPHASLFTHPIPRAHPPATELRCMLISWCLLHAQILN